MKIVPACLVLAAAASALPAAAQMSPNDAAAFKEAAGTYSPACGKAGAPRTVITPTSVTLEAGGKRRQGKAEMASVSSFGRAGPPKAYADFHVELFSSAGNLYVMHGKAGKYLVFPERAELEKHFGKGTFASRFARCA